MRLRVRGDTTAERKIPGSFNALHGAAARSARGMGRDAVGQGAGNMEPVKFATCLLQARPDAGRTDTAWRAARGACSSASPRRAGARQQELEILRMNAAFVAEALNAA